MPGPSLTLPSIDQNTCMTWTVDDIDYYNKLPYFFVKATGAWQQRWNTWDKLLDTVPWTPNVADTMKMVGIEPTPVLRQMAFPSLLKDTPSTDIAHVKERTTTAQLYEHQFETPHFFYLPSFQDFLGNKIGPYRADLNKMVMVYTESFYRTHMFHFAPYVYIAGVGMVAAPSSAGNAAGTGGKTNAWLAANVLNKAITPLSFKTLYAALNQFEQEVGATPFSGTQLPNGLSAPLDDKFLLVGPSEVWNNFIDDPWLKENRPLNLNIITQGFYGDIFGRIRFRHEKYGLRIAVDDTDFTPTYHAPEISVLGDANDPELYRTMPNPNYASSAVSEIGVAWLVGGPSYKIINVGPPPEAFTSTDVNGIMGMNWNGKVYMNKNFLIPCVADDRTVFYKTNDRGRYLRLQADATMGIVGYNKFNVMPIFYQRKNVISTIL
jgi:hypothetical protein